MQDLGSERQDLGMPDIDEVADELYGLPPEEFTAARTRHEKEAKAAGDRAAAAEIHGLAKPTVTGWLANQLVRSHRSSLEPVLELGAAFATPRRIWTAISCGNCRGSSRR